MADVFLSYASDDRDRVAPLVEFLESRGWSVWWDRTLRPGETWPQVIERELDLARCVIVAWSKQSVISPWVRVEAHRARERHNIVPVVLDDATVPPEFATFQSFDMRSASDDRAFGPLGDSVAAQLRRHRLRRSAIAAGALAAVLASVAAATCTFSDLCGSWSVARSIPETSFAVVATALQVDNQTTNELLEAFVDDVRRNLRRTAIGKVASRAETSAAPTGLSPIDLGKRLRVRWLLALSIAGNSDRLRVLAELVDTSTGYLTDDWRLDSSLAELNGLNATLVRNIAARFVADSNDVRIATNEPGEAYARYLEGRAALRDGSDSAQLARAEAIFQSVLREWPTFGRAEAALCEINLLRYETTRAPDEFETGERHCNHALELDPKSEEAAVALGRLYLDQGRNRLAQEAFTRALNGSATVADARMGLGEAAFAEGRLQDAEREFRLAIEAEPGYWRTYTALGNFLFQTGRARESLTEHRIAAGLAKHDGVALNNIGAASFLTGQMEAAIAAWQSALALAPQAPTYSNLGAAYYLLGDYDKAVTMYERSIAMVTDDYRVWTNLADARAFARRGDAGDAYRTAARLIERELTANPNDSLARMGLAAVRAALGDAASAQETLELALQEDRDDDWQLHYIAAVTEVRLGRPDDARPHVAAAIRAGYPKILVDLDPTLRGAMPSRS